MGATLQGEAYSSSGLGNSVDVASRSGWFPQNSKVQDPAASGSNDSHNSAIFMVTEWRAPWLDSLVLNPPKYVYFNLKANGGCRHSMYVSIVLEVLYIYIYILQIYMQYLVVALPGEPA